MGLLFRTKDFLPGIEEMRTTTRYCKLHSENSRKEVMLDAFNTKAHGNTSKEKGNKIASDFPERMMQQKTSRKKAQRSTSKKKVRPGASHKKVHPSEKMVRSEEKKWRGSREIWRVKGKEN